MAFGRVINLSLFSGAFLILALEALHPVIPTPAPIPVKPRQSVTLLLGRASSPLALKERRKLSLWAEGPRSQVAGYAPTPPGLVSSGPVAGLWKAKIKAPCAKK